MSARLLYTLPLYLIMLTSSAFAISGNGVNEIDASGQRQGYWIISGYMINDPEYASDAKVEEGVYKDSRKEGLWKKYWPSGKLRSEITYTEGRPQGWYRTYYQNGVCEEEGCWWNNKNTGYFKRWHDNGKAQQMFSFDDNGKRQGMQRYYYDNGNTELEVEMHNGQESGICRRYNPDGTLAEEKVFNNGSVVPGTLKTFKAVKPATAAVPEKDPYDPNIGKGSAAPKESKPNKAEEFRPNGFNSLYNAQSQLTEIGEFKNGKLMNGKVYRYNSNGLLIRIEIYKNGKYVGNGVIGDEEH